MIRRILLLLITVWLLGFAWFVVSLPVPAGAEKTDGIVVLTGGKGRIVQGLQALEAGYAKRVLISGVDPTVRPGELAEAIKQPIRLFRCCVDLGKEAIDTRTNADETAAWLRKHNYKSVRLVTSDWHMPRARFELRRTVGQSVTIVSDAVDTTPGLAVLFNEYNKLLARRAQSLMDRD